MKLILKLRKKEANRDKINEITGKLGYNRADIVISDEKSGLHAWTIETEEGKVLDVVIFSADDSSAARNSYIVQYVGPVIVKYSIHNPKYHIYFLSEKIAESGFNVNAYNILNSLEFNFLNFKTQIDNLLIDGFEKSIDRFVMMKNESRKKNSGNAGTFLNYNGSSLEIFSKWFGANAYDSLLTILFILKWFNKITVSIYIIEDNGANKPSHKILEMLKSYKNVHVETEIIYSQKAIGKGCKNDLSKKSSRNQPQFKYSLFEKYGAKKCYICGYDIQETIIAAHIHRIADIDKSQLSSKEKENQAIDPNNGFWLCANHDKLFETGIIYIDSDKIQFHLNSSIKNMAAFRNEKVIIDKSVINKKDFNYHSAESESMEWYVKQHMSRVSNKIIHD